jgi:hypothetical protein
MNLSREIRIRVWIFGDSNSLNFAAASSSKNGASPGGRTTTFSQQHGLIIEKQHLDVPVAESIGTVVPHVLGILLLVGQDNC